MQTDITKKGLTKCQRCNAPFDQDIDLKGRINSEGMCSHYNSECGWWLRIDHCRDFYDHSNITNVIGDFMCPDCVQKDAEWIDEVLSNKKESKKVIGNKEK